MDLYDLIIIGSGPAGLTASIYASRYKIPHLIIGRMPGGLAGTAHKIYNFPSYQEISGMKLMAKMQEQAEALGGKILLDEVVRIQKDNYFTVFTKANKKFKSKTILLAIGTRRRKLGLENEDKFLGKGISYCATCDGFFYKDKIVAVIGGGDAASTASLILTDIAKKVYQIFLEDEMHGETAWIEQVIKNPKIEIISNNSVIGLEGADKLNTSHSVSSAAPAEGPAKLKKILLDKPFQGNKELAIDGIFVEIGSIPETTLSEQLKLKTKKPGYIITNHDQSTNIKGVWAAGDITTGSNEFRQITTACSEAAVAAENIFKFLKNRS
jgi:thioredoxin reductase (NADPH)